MRPHSFYYSSKKIIFLPPNRHFYFNRIFIHFIKKLFLFESACSSKPFRSVILRVRASFLPSCPRICQEACIRQVSVSLCLVSVAQFSPHGSLFPWVIHHLLRLFGSSSCGELPWSIFTVKMFCCWTLGLYFSCSYLKVRNKFECTSHAIVRGR